MSPTYQIILIDQSGVQQALDFDYRHQNHKTLYNEVRSEIKKVFAEKIELIASLFPEGEITINVNLEQEKKDEATVTLASFDSERSGNAIYVFHIYYSTICQIANAILTPNQDSILYSFSDTVMHELIHAADLAVLKESNAIREHSYRIHAKGNLQILRDLNETSYDWNVQWTLLRFFQIFRNEGVAILGQHLLNKNRTIHNNERQIQTVMIRFKEVLITVLNTCSGLKYYNSIENTNAHQILQELSLEAYQYGDIVLLEMLRTLSPAHSLLIEKSIPGNLEISNESIDENESLAILKIGMQIDLSEYIQAIFNNELLNKDEPLPKQQFFECCAIIQNDLQIDTISRFSKSIGICGYNKNRDLFIETIREIIGSKMSVDEINNSFLAFTKKEYPEDIVHSIRKMAEYLFPLAVNENNEVASWALTYLLDDQDLVHDDMSVLGWQDDWMVMNAAVSIIK